MEPTELTLTELAGAIAERSLTAERAVRASLDRIGSLDGDMRCFLETFGDRAVEQARRIDQRLDAGDDVGPLAGVPIALKDNMCLEYGRTTCGSRILEHYESPFTGTAAQKLIDAGAVIVGKTNLDEFAMGSSCEHSAFGPTRNPWDRERVTGGSSGGSAACVAARMVPGSLGSDTGGSIRQPASLCGVVGLKPTYGRVSRWGLVAFASSLDQIGPFARTVRDCAALTELICGRDPLDSTSADVDAPELLRDLERPIEGLRIGVPAQARSDRNHPAVSAAFDRSIETYRSMGAQIVDIELPHLEYGIAAYYIVAPAEASSNLARYDGIRYGRRAEIRSGEDLIDLYARSRAEGFGPEVQRRIMLGTHALSSGYYDAYYLTALKTRRLIKRDLDRAFSSESGGPDVHAIAMPSAPGPAFRIGEKVGDPLALYLEDVYTVIVNLAGVTGISLPCGFASGEASGGGDLPVGLQLVAPAFEESRLLRIARMFEGATDFAGAAPAL